MTLDQSPFAEDLEWLQSRTPHDRDIPIQSQAYHAERIGERVMRDRQDALSARNAELELMLTQW
jgi:hypothetical protein